MASTRKPPKPLHYDTAPKGVCRWCNEPVLKKDGSVNTRANWHNPKCVHEFRLLNHPSYTRRAVWKRDKGVCYLCCETVSKKAWEMEHIKPLFEAEGDLTFWQLPNIAVCCVPCHRKKSAEEAGRRAAIRKAAKANINIDK